MDKVAYFKLYKHPKWQKKRCEIYELDHWTCLNCGDDSKQLHAHHIKYMWDHAPWDYPNNWIITLCEPCHDGVKTVGLRTSAWDLRDVGLPVEEKIDYFSQFLERWCLRCTVDYKHNTWCTINLSRIKYIPEERLNNGKCSRWTWNNLTYDEEGVF